MIIIRSHLLNKFAELVFGFSTKIGLNRIAPYFFNLSNSVEDDFITVEENRESFFKELGINKSKIVFQKQIHSEKVTVVEKAGVIDESDAMITNRKGIGLAISSADCAAIFIYDYRNKVIAAVHSGWCGTAKKILENTLSLMQSQFKTETGNLYVYIAPSISQNNYEIGSDVAVRFDEKYIKNIRGRSFLNITGVNLDILKNFGVPASQVQNSSLCTYQNYKLLHSYRRTGKLSGRALGIIAMKE